MDPGAFGDVPSSAAAIRSTTACMRFCPCGPASSVTASVVIAAPSAAFCVASAFSSPAPSSSGLRASAPNEPGIGRAMPPLGMPLPFASGSWRSPANSISKDDEDPAASVAAAPSAARGGTAPPATADVGPSSAPLVI